MPVPFKIVLLMLALVIGRPAAAFAADASQTVTQFVAAVTAADGTDARLGRALDEHLALTEMAARSLGSSQNLPDALRQQYVRSFRNLFVRFLKNRTPQLKAGKLQILGVKPGANQTEIVYSRLSVAGERERDMVWYVRSNRNPAIVDLAYDGVLVSDRYKQELAAITQRLAGDMSALPAAMDAIDP